MTGRQHLQQAGATNSGLHMNTNDNSISSDTSESDGTYSTILWAISWINLSFQIMKFRIL